MTDKRSESERVTARTPMPSMAPPTDDIDSEWGADPIPAPAAVPECAAPPAPPAAAATPAPRPSSVPAPRPSATPVAIKSQPAASAAGTPLVVAHNPLRNQTLLGLSPVAGARSKPVAAITSEPVAPAPVVPATSEPTFAVAGAPLTLPAQNPLRKQTLLGLAPVAREPDRAKSEPETAPASPEPAAETASSPSSVVIPAVVATDAPTTSDVLEAETAATTIEKPKAPGTERARALAALSTSHDDLPELKPRRPSWVLPVGAAAVLLLGVVGLRKLDHPPTPVPAELGRPLSAAKVPAKVAAAIPQSDEDDDDDDGDGPSTGNEPTPEPLPPEPDPLKAKGESATGPANAPSAAPADKATGSSIRISIESDPPAARMFWKGKEVGTTPFVLEFGAGERHAYELVLPGYTTRKVVIDGSKTEISIGLRPAPGRPPSVKSRK